MIAFIRAPCFADVQAICSADLRAICSAELRATLPTSGDMLSHPSYMLSRRARCSACLRAICSADIRAYGVCTNLHYQIITNATISDYVLGSHACADIIAAAAVAINATTGNRVASSNLAEKRSVVCIVVNSRKLVSSDAKPRFSKNATPSTINQYSHYRF